MNIKRCMRMSVLGIAIVVAPLTILAYQPGDHDLLLMPTAYTMEQGQFYFSDYELLFLNLSYAPTNRTHIGVYALFPINGEAFVNSLTVGFKQNYVRLPTVEAALTASYTPKIEGVLIGNVVSIGHPENGGHLGIGLAHGFEGGGEEGVNSGAGIENWEVFYMLGYRFDIAPRFTLLAEYLNAQGALEEGAKGFLSFGIRFRGERVAWDLGGMRPLDLDDEDEEIFLFPLLKATVVF